MCRIEAIDNRCNMDSDAASCEVDAAALGWEALHEVAMSSARGAGVPA
jgi:hypothetical protein